MNILIYGLQRSGTNYIEKVFTDRYRITYLNDNADTAYPGAKHFRLYANKAIIPHPVYFNNITVSNFASFEALLDNVPDYYLVISKDPYSWLLSYEKWAEKCKWEKVNHHYVEEYNQFYGKWLELAEQTNKIVFVRYIDLLQNIEQELQRLEKAMKLTKKILGMFAPIKYRNLPKSEKFTHEHYEYYANELYLANYSQVGLNEANNHLDHDIMSKLGYTVRYNVEQQ